MKPFKLASCLRPPALAFLGLALALVAQALGAPPAAAQKSLHIVFVPQEDPRRLENDIRGFATWLGAEIGRDVKTHISLDQASAIQALASGQADISFLGALPYLIAKREAGVHPLVEEIYRGQPSYRGRIYVRRDSGIKRLRDLGGKAVAFVDPLSESGYMFPLQIFVDRGLIRADGKNLRDFFGAVLFAGGYQQALAALANGSVEAAAASEFALSLLPAHEAASLTWIGETEAIPSHLVVARRELPQAVRDLVRAALLKLNDPRLASIRAYVFSPDGYRRANEHRYRRVEEIARRFGLL